MQSTIRGADGVRAMACLMVMTHHLCQRLNSNDMSAPVQIAASFGWSVASGVSVFFVLSGMLLARPFWQAYLDGQAMPCLQVFAVRRFARIAPAFYVAMLLLFACQMALVPAEQLQAPWLRLFAGLSFTAGLHWLTLFPNELDGPFWSVSLEVMCYAMLPLFLWPLFARLRGRGLRYGLLWWCAGFALVLLVNAGVMAFCQTSPDGKGWQYGLIGGAKSWVPHYNPVGMFGQYLFGVLAAGLIAWLPRQPWTARAQARGVFDVLAIVALLGGLALHVRWLQLAAQTHHFPGYPMSWQEQPYFFPYFAALVALLLVAASASRGVGRLLDNGLFRWVAKISFGLYLWHYAVIELINRLVAPDFHVFGVSSLARWGALVGVVVILAVMLAALSYRYVELPALRYARAWEKQRETRRPLATEQVQA